MSTRVAVVDLGSNSTRLLIADLHANRRIEELERRSIVTRLGQGVDATNELAPEAMQRVYAALTEYRTAIDERRADVAVGVLTSAVRDAANGEEFTDTVRNRFRIAARAIPGEEEARLTYIGATSERETTRPTAVIDIGGGSTEVIVGAGHDLRFHVSTQVGVVRHSERHLADDPPTPQQVAALRADAAGTFAAELPADLGAAEGIAVAGTATQTAAMLGVTQLEHDAVEALLGRLAAMPLDERRTVPGLDPDRAPTIVAGLAVLLEVTAALGLTRVEASDHDILRGAALEHTTFLPTRPT